MACLFITQTHMNTHTHTHLWFCLCKDFHAIMYPYHHTNHHNQMANLNPILRWTSKPSLNHITHLWSCEDQTIFIHFLKCPPYDLWNWGPSNSVVYYYPFIYLLRIPSASQQLLSESQYPRQINSPSQDTHSIHSHTHTQGQFRVPNNADVHAFPAVGGKWRT